MARAELAVAASSRAVLMGLAPLLQGPAYDAAAGLPALIVPHCVALLAGGTATIIALRLRRRQ